MYVDPRKCGAVYPNAPCSMCPQTSVGMVNASDSQNLSRNIETLWPACLS
jgi:hypothetical protein